MSITSIPIPLDNLWFKGKRDYLQGADIMSSALRCLTDDAQLGNISQIDVSFHTLVRGGLALHTGESAHERPPVQISCRANGQTCKFFLVEDGRVIHDRRPYPEEQIVDTTTIDTATATAINHAALPFTNIERWIAMIKALHHATFPSATGKWLFARARLSHYRENHPKAVEHRAVIQSGFGGRMTRRALTVDDQLLGDIFFVLT